MSTVIATRKGMVLRIEPGHIYTTNRAGKGVASISLDEGDSVIGSIEVSDMDNVVLISTDGKFIQFKADQIRVMQRNCRGVKGMILAKGEDVVSIDKVEFRGIDVLNSLNENYTSRNPLIDDLFNIVNDESLDIGDEARAILSTKVVLLQNQDAQIWGDDE